MTEPDLADVLATAITTIERDIAPNVTADDDGYTTSLCRTVAQLLRAVGSRIEHEEPALSADNAELRELLNTWSSDLPATAREQVEQALRIEDASGERARIAGLRADAERLRSALVALIEAVPDPSSPARIACREYLRHQLDRQRPWMIDAFTGPRR